MLQTMLPKEAIDFETNKRLLNRYRFVEYELMRSLTGWLPATGRMEWKLAMGRLLWEDAQHVQQLYQRLREVQTPAFRPPDDEALEALMAAALNAPNEADLLAGLFRVIKPALLAAYQWHITQTFANPDAPTLYAFKHIVLDEAEHVQWAQVELADHPVGAWEAYLTDLLCAAGGITGNETRLPLTAKVELGRPFTLPRQAARDARFALVNRNAGKIQRDPDLATRRRMEFENYSQEMLAAETVANVLFASPQMPWPFVYDSARHLYDETRHCKLGIEWMAHYGIDFTTVPQNTLIYEWRSQYDPATQYTMLTMGNEVHAFPYRHESIKAYEQIDDQLSIQYINYDMADERTHVAYGKKWIPELLKAQGIETPPEQFVEETVALWEREYRSGLLPIHAQG